MIDLYYDATYRASYFALGSQVLLVVAAIVVADVAAIVAD